MKRSLKPLTGLRGLLRAIDEQIVVLLPVHYSLGGQIKELKKRREYVARAIRGYEKI